MTKKRIETTETQKKSIERAANIGISLLVQLLIGVKQFYS